MTKLFGTLSFHLAVLATATLVAPQALAAKKATKKEKSCRDSAIEMIKSKALVTLPKKDRKQARVHLVSTTTDKPIEIPDSELAWEASANFTGLKENPPPICYRIFQNKKTCTAVRIVEVKCAL